LGWVVFDHRLLAAQAVSFVSDPFGSVPKTRKSCAINEPRGHIWLAQRMARFLEISVRFRKMITRLGSFSPNLERLRAIF